MNNHKFKSSTAFTDLLFLMLSGVTTLFVLSFLLINPISKSEDVPSPAKYLITMEYDKESNDDLDLWLQTPSGTIIYYGNRGTGFTNLERDDLGKKTDCAIVKGEEICIPINREVITLRGVEEGEYKLQMRVYIQMVNGRPTGNPAHFEIVGINPYKVLFTKDVEYVDARQRFSVIRFTVRDGEIVSFSDLPFELKLEGDAR